jgi:hypothetical protein
MTRLWANGEQIEMQSTRQGTPIAFYWGQSKHTITAILQRWRVDTDWWRTPVQKEYFQVQTDTGLLVTCYFDGTQWYLQRVYD